MLSRAVKWGSRFGKCLTILKMLELPYDPEIPLPGTQEKGKHTTVQTHAHRRSQQRYS